MNLKYGGKTDEAGGTLWQKDYTAAAKADPATKTIPWVAHTAIFTDYRHAKPFADFAFANIHSYQGTGVPSSSLLQNVTWFNNIYPVGTVIKPFVPTECGYIEGIKGKITAKLSDGSAPEYVSTIFDANTTGQGFAPEPGSFTAVYTVR